MKDKKAKSKKSEKNEEDGDNQGEKINDRSWIKNDYIEARTAAKEARASYVKNRERDLEETPYQPHMGVSMPHAYGDTSVQDVVMKMNHNPVKCTPFGLRPVDAISCECCRDSTLRPVAPHKSLNMDSRFRLCDMHLKEAEENENPSNSEEQDEGSGNDKKKKDAKNDSKKDEKKDEKKDAKKEDPKKDQKKEDPKKDQKKEDPKKDQKKDGKKGEQGKDGKEEGEDKDESDAEPRYMQIPYQLPRERRVEFRPILTEKRKSELNFDDLKHIRREINEQKKEQAAKRHEENKELVERDWQEMQFDDLYTLRLENDKKRMHGPVVHYFGANKKGAREAAIEKAEPLCPGLGDPNKDQRLQAQLAKVQGQG